MVELDKLRVTKLKCLSCGCRDKRIALLSSTLTGKRIGIATICCNCGEVRTYISRITRDKTKELSEKNKEENSCCCGCQQDKQETDNFFFDNEDVLSYLLSNYEVSDIFCAIPDPYCPRKNCPLYPSKPEQDLTIGDLYNGYFPNSIYNQTYKEPINLKEKCIEEKKKFL